MGWLLTLLYQLGASTVVINWSHYVVHLINLISDYNVTESVIQAAVAGSDGTNLFHSTGQIINLPAIAITIAVTLIVIIGIRPTAIVNLVLVVIKVTILLIFIFAGCAHVDRKNYDHFFPLNEGRMIRSIYNETNNIFCDLGSISHYGAGGMFYASTFVFFAYVGFESVTTVAQEARQPSRSMPLALIGSLVISLLIYVGVCTVMVGLVPYQVLRTTYPLLAAA
jgi:APA family basic amino acid/polyamine antiporter